MLNFARIGEDWWVQETLKLVNFLKTTVLVSFSVIFRPAWRQYIPIGLKFGIVLHTIVPLSRHS